MVPNDSYSLELSLSLSLSPFLSLSLSQARCVFYQVNVVTLRRVQIREEMRERKVYVSVVTCRHEALSIRDELHSEHSFVMVQKNRPERSVGLASQAEANHALCNAHSDHNHSRKLLGSLSVVVVVVNSRLY